MFSAKRSRSRSLFGRSKATTHKDSCLPRIERPAMGSNPSLYTMLAIGMQVAASQGERRKGLMELEDMDKEDLDHPANQQPAT
eukprot:6209196-Pleurochrysis_carterae.AAC.1